MAFFILRRLAQAALTILGVLLITFLLFRVIAGDIASARLGQKARASEKAEWRYRYGYFLPVLYNLHGQVVLADYSGGQGLFEVKDVPAGGAVDALSLIRPDKDDAQRLTPRAQAASPPVLLMGRYVEGLSAKTPLGKLTEGRPLVNAQAAARLAAATAPSTATAPASEAAETAEPAEASDEPPAPGIAAPGMIAVLADGSRIGVDLSGVATAGELVARINAASPQGRLKAWISPPSWGRLFQSQFFRHFVRSLTFEGRSVVDNKKLTEIIAEKAKYSLALTVPAMAIEWMIGLGIAAMVAYYRGRPVDKVGTFVSVLGMCLPILAFMIYGQRLVFAFLPAHAYGVFYRSNAYVPVLIMVVASLGGLVRFYRTVILDQLGNDYVRTARAKGLPLAAVLFKHVLKNCMLPILTSLILAIPFLIMGSLLLEVYFGVPGLGGLMLNSITSRDEPILSGMVFLTALVYTVGMLVTDLAYAVFDPRIRLR